MIDLIAAACWSYEELLAAVVSETPPDLVVSYIRSSEAFKVTIFSGETVVWEDSGVDPCLVLLNTLGFFTASKEAGSPWWVRHRALDLQSVSNPEKAPDPEDLDPDFLESVYRHSD